jgi:hypothetical protein
VLDDALHVRGQGLLQIPSFEHEVGHLVVERVQHLVVHGRHARAARPARGELLRRVVHLVEEVGAQVGVAPRVDRVADQRPYLLVEVDDPLLDGDRLALQVGEVDLAAVALAREERPGEGHLPSPEVVGQGRDVLGVPAVRRRLLELREQVIVEAQGPVGVVGGVLDELPEILLDDLAHRVEGGALARLRALLHLAEGLGEGCPLPAEGGLVHLLEAVRFLLVEQPVHHGHIGDDSCEVDADVGEHVHVELRVREDPDLVPVGEALEKLLGGLDGHRQAACRFPRAVVRK